MPQSALSHFLYTSMLEAGEPATTVAAIVRHARAANATQGLSGVLVFDGQAFCQYVEGPAQAVDRLLEKLQRDVRHTRFVLQHRGPLTGERRFRQWSMAYALAGDPEMLEGLQALRGPQAVEALEALIPELDLGPSLPA